MWGSEYILFLFWESGLDKYLLNITTIKWSLIVDGKGGKCPEFHHKIRLSKNVLENILNVGVPKSTIFDGVAFLHINVMFQMKNSPSHYTGNIVD
eukprot:7474739-Ditylum_brightwellii.AAC.1